ncbi:protein of unknown function [Streptococcus thermophilus]|nr:protein of unknown function [Streptococcus thermophilus]
MFGGELSQQKKAKCQMPQPKFYGIIFSQDSITTLSVVSLR